MDRSLSLNSNDSKQTTKHTRRGSTTARNLAIPNTITVKTARFQPISVITALKLIVAPSNERERHDGRW